MQAEKSQSRSPSLLASPSPTRLELRSWHETQSYLEALDKEIETDVTAFELKVEPIETLVLHDLPTLGQLRLIEWFCKKARTSHLFPQANHMVLLKKCQPRLTQYLCTNTTPDENRRYVDLLAKLCSPKTLCSDHVFQGIGGEPVPQAAHGWGPPVVDAMFQLRNLWPNLKTHVIHQALDDLPCTMPGIQHIALYHRRSFPFDTPRSYRVPIKPIPEDECEIVMLAELCKEEGFRHYRQPSKFKDESPIDVWLVNTAKTVVEASKWDALYSSFLSGGGSLGTQTIRWKVSLPPIWDDVKRHEMEDGTLDFGSMLEKQILAERTKGRVHKQRRGQCSMDVTSKANDVEWVFRSTSYAECEACGWTSSRSEWAREKQA